MTPLGDAISAYSVATMMTLQEFVQQKVEPYVGGWLWDPVVQGLLMLPSWIVLGAIGFLFTWLGARGRRRTTAFA